MPVIFYVHGGGWIMGTQRLGGLACISGALAHGYAVISVEYRLAPAVHFPEFIFDVKTAVRWARANAPQYGFDPARIGMIGDSAGGHISLMFGFTADRPEYEGIHYGHAGYSSAIQAVVDMYGPADLAADEDQWYQESKVRCSESLPCGENHHVRCGLWHREQGSAATHQSHQPGASPHTAGAAAPRPQRLYCPLPALCHTGPPH